MSATGFSPASWSPPTPEEVKHLTQKASQGATESERIEAVRKLGETILTLNNALAQAQEAHRVSEANCNNLRLTQFLAPILAPILATGVKEKDAPPATDGPESATWPTFVDWELKHTLPAPQFTLHQQLLTRRDQFFHAMLADSPLSNQDAALTALRAKWQADQSMLAMERDALLRVFALAQKTKQDAINLHNQREIARGEIQTVRERAMIDINAICIPFTELVALSTEAARFAATMDLSTSDKLPHETFQGLQHRFTSFVKAHPDLFTVGEWKEITDKALLLRSNLSETLNLVLCKLIKRKVELELFQLVTPLNCAPFNEVLRDHFLLLEEIKTWKKFQSLPLLDPQEQPQSAELLKRVKQVLKKWENVEAAKAKEVTQQLPKLMPEDPKIKYKDVLTAPMLSFSPEEQKSACKQLFTLHAEILHLCQCLKNFQESFKLDEDLHMLDLLKGASNLQFAELVVRMVFLQRDMQRCKEEYNGEKAHLALRFSQFTTRYNQLEERMHEVTEANFKKWQEEIKKAVKAQSMHWELRDIHKIGCDLSFEMRHFQKAVGEGKFSYVTTQAAKEFFSKINQFPWKGAAKQPV